MDLPEEHGIYQEMSAALERSYHMGMYDILKKATQLSDQQPDMTIQELIQELEAIAGRSEKHHAERLDNLRETKHDNRS